MGIPEYIQLISMTIAVIGMFKVIMGGVLAFVANQDNRKDAEKYFLKIYTVGAIMMVLGMGITLFLLLFYGV